MDQSESQGSALSERLKNLTRLGCAIAIRSDAKIPSCVENCLRSGATRDEIMEVVGMAILMAEVPANAYRAMVSDAIDDFERRG